MIVYDNPKRRDGMEVSLRPIAIAEEELVLDPGAVALTVVNYILFDYTNHPEWFEGIDVETLLEKLLAPFPEITERPN